MNASKVRRALLFCIPIALALIVTVRLANDNSAKRSVDIAAQEPSYATLADLVHAADLVVVARATETREGRTVSGIDAKGAIRTQLVSLEVGDVLDGSTDKHLTLEQEYSLYDGTPITINGVAPMSVNDEMLLFLVKSSDEVAPYVAVVNAQGRYTVAGSERELLRPAGADALSKQLAASGRYELRCAVLAIGDTGRSCDSLPVPSS